MAEAPFSKEAYTRALDIEDVYGEKGYTTNERNSIRPTLDVNGIVEKPPGSSNRPDRGTKKRLAYLVLEEAWAWNHAGRLGMHRKALDPLVAAQVPVHIRSTEAPDLPGTLILPAGHPRAPLARAL